MILSKENLLWAAGALIAANLLLAGAMFFTDPLKDGTMICRAIEG